MPVKGSCILEAWCIQVRCTEEMHIRYSEVKPKLPNKTERNFIHSKNLSPCSKKLYPSNCPLQPSCMGYASFVHPFFNNRKIRPCIWSANRLHLVCMASASFVQFVCNSYASDSGLFLCLLHLHLICISSANRLHFICMASASFVQFVCNSSAFDLHFICNDFWREVSCSVLRTGLGLLDQDFTISGKISGRNCL